MANDRIYNKKPISQSQDTLLNLKIVRYQKKNIKKTLIKRFSNWKNPKMLVKISLLTK